MVRLLIFSAFAVFLFFGCDEIDDPAVEASPPTIKIDFDARESLESTEVLYDSLDFRVDSLTLERDTIRRGGGNPEDSVAILLALEQLEPVRDSLKAVNDLFQSSKIRLDSLIALGGNFIEEYQDTVNSAFNLPLNLHSDSSFFFIRFHQFTDTIVIKYQKEVTTRPEKIVVVATRVSARNTNKQIEISRYTCPEENCISSEITYKIYF